MSDAKKILAIDTSTDVSSIAMGEVEVLWKGDRNQSVDLLPRIEGLLKELEVEFDDLEGVTVINGPGSYTGIRIGVSVANTIGMLVGCQVRAMDGLMAQACIPKLEVQSSVVSLISAGGLRVYGRKFVQKKDRLEPVGDFWVGEVEDYLNDGEEVVVAEVNEELENWLKGQNLKYLHLIEVKNKIGRAKMAAKYFAELEKSKNNVVVPMYLRGPVAGR